jgi:FAD/FMN-containing dehydrogenase
MTTRRKVKRDKLQSRIKGEVLSPGDAGYDDARRVWNARIDRQPALIVRCAEAADVAPAIAFARENGLELSVAAEDTTSPAIRFRTAA